MTPDLNPQASVVYNLPFKEMFCTFGVVGGHEYTSLA